MDERIVVCLSVQGSHPTDYAARVDTLMQRASAFGATICACGWEGLAFAFHPDEAEEAVEFCRASDAAPLTTGFGVGIARGGLAALVEPSSSLELGWGTALSRASRVAALAQPGEVLLERALLLNHFKLAPGEPRTLHPDGLLVVALAPMSDGSAERRPILVRLARSVFAGRPSCLDLLAGDPGTLASLRAAPGVGGTRVLLECGLAVSPAPSLLLRPSGAAVEPLASLRFAFAREIAQFRARPLPDASGTTLSDLLEGKGATVEAAATLLEAWLQGETPGLLLLDDANDIDPSSLEVVANSLLDAKHPFRAIARLDAESPLPAVLALLPPGPEITTGPLLPGDADLIAASWLGCPIGDDALRALIASTDGSPLALRDRLIDGLSSGDITLSDGVARWRGVAPPRAFDSARTCLTDRLARISANGRALLLAVAMLGGDASDEVAAALVESAADVPVEFVEEVKALIDAGWLEEPEPGWLALPSKTHTRVVLASLHEDRRSSWHRAASLALETHGLGLTYAEAAWHAAKAGDNRRASRLATEAASVADAAKLEGAARALVLLASSPVRWSPEAESQPGHAHLRTIPPTPEQALAARLVSHGRVAGAGDSYLPLDFPDPVTPPPAPTSVPRPGQTVPRAPRPTAERVTAGARPPPQAAPTLPSYQAAKLPLPPALPKPPDDAPTVEIPAVTAAAAPGPRDSFASLPAAHVDELASTLPLIAREALESGNEEALEQWFTELEGAGKSPRLLERLRAIAALRGQPAGTALATLREACVQAKPWGQLERSRSHLALALGLARVGRYTDSLIEALEALSRAREASDAHAEHACVRFLQQLYGAAGQHVGAFGGH